MRSWNDYLFEIEVAMTGLILIVFAVHMYFEAEPKSNVFSVASIGLVVTLIALMAIYIDKRNLPKEGRNGPTDNFSA